MLARHLQSFLPVSGITAVPCSCDDWGKIHLDGIQRTNTALFNPVFFIQTVFSWIHGIREVIPNQMLSNRQIRQIQWGSITETAEQRHSCVLFQTLSDHKMFHFGILDSAAAFDPARGLADWWKGEVWFQTPWSYIQSCPSVCCYDVTLPRIQISLSLIYCVTRKEGGHVRGSADIIKFWY